MNVKPNVGPSLIDNDRISSTSSSDEEKNPLRGTSALGRLNGAPVSIRFNETKKNIKTPTPSELAEEQKAYSDYRAALIQQKDEKKFYRHTTSARKPRKMSKKA